MPSVVIILTPRGESANPAGCKEIAMHRMLQYRKSLVVMVWIVAIGGIVWWQRAPVFSWYYLRELTAADAQSRERWAERVASLDTAAVPGLLACLEQSEPTVCINAEAGLVALMKRWGPEDPRMHAFADELRQRFGTLSPLGQGATLQALTALLREDGPAEWPVAVTHAAGDILHATRDRLELRGAALVLAGALLDRVPPGKWLDPCRALAEQGLGDKQPRTRLAAIQLAARQIGRAHV